MNSQGNAFFLRPLGYASLHSLISIGPQFRGEKDRFLDLGHVFGKASGTDESEGTEFDLKSQVEMEFFLNIGDSAKEFVLRNAAIGANLCLM